MRVALLATALVLLASLPALAQDEEPSLSFFYPLITRRPVIEREIELRAVHLKNDDGRETVTAAALEWPLLRAWQVEIEMPLVIRDPREGATEAGAGDLEIDNKVLLVSSIQHKFALGAGLEVRLPTGSEPRGLGGETAAEPYVTAGIALGDFDVLASTAYEVNLNAHLHEPREHELSASIAAGYRGSRWLTPLVELTTVTRTRGDNEDGLRGRTQVYVTPGVNTRPLPGTTLRFGVQLPVTRAREVDYAVHAGLVWEF